MKDYIAAGLIGLLLGISLMTVVAGVWLMPYSAQLWKEACGLGTDEVPYREPKVCRAIKEQGLCDAPASTPKPLP